MIELVIDVTEAADLAEPAEIAATVHLPDPRELAEPAVICFAKPGGGYSKEYYTAALPGPGGGSQADWHSGRGWIFVAIDHLGVGASTPGRDPSKLGYTTLAAASWSAEQQILSRLADGTLAPGFPPVNLPLLLGIGQSMGGCMTIIQQGRHHCYDGIGVLGYSAIHTHPPAAPGAPTICVPWVPRDAMRLDPFIATNPVQLADAEPIAYSSQLGPAMAWGFFYDDVAREIVDRDLENFPVGTADLPPWRSSTLPVPVALETLTPGAVAPEAAAVTVPVLVATGERDVVADPKGEPRAYLSARSVDLFVCPRMGHMHNFAGTRQLLWRRIEKWAAWVADERASTRPQP